MTELRKAHILMDKENVNAVQSGSKRGEFFRYGDVVCHDISVGDEVEIYAHPEDTLCASAPIKEIRVVKVKDVTLEELREAGYEDAFEFTNKWVVPHVVTHDEDIVLIRFSMSKLFFRTEFLAGMPSEINFTIARP